MSERQARINDAGGAEQGEGKLDDSDDDHDPDSSLPSSLALPSVLNEPNVETSVPAQIGNNEEPESDDVVILSSEPGSQHCQSPPRLPPRAGPAPLLPRPVLLRRVPC